MVCPLGFEETTPAVEITDTLLTLQVMGSFIPLKKIYKISIIRQVEHVTVFNKLNHQFNPLQMAKIVAKIVINCNKVIALQQRG